MFGKFFSIVGECSLKKMSQKPETFGTIFLLCFHRRLIKTLHHEPDAMGRDVGWMPRTKRSQSILETYASEGFSVRAKKCWMLEAYDFDTGICLMLSCMSLTYMPSRSLRKILILFLLTM